MNFCINVEIAPTLMCLKMNFLKSNTVLILEIK